MTFEIPILISGGKKELDETTEQFNSILNPTVKMLCLFLRACVESGKLELINDVEKTISEIAKYQVLENQK